MRILGIDPGLSGALVLLVTTTEERLAARLAMPTLAVTRAPSAAARKRATAAGRPAPKSTRQEYDPCELARLLRELAPDLVALEHATVRPDQPANTMFGVGYGYGLLEGLCVGLGLRYVTVYPQTWQARMLAGIPGEDTKTRAYIACCRRWGAGIDWRAPGASDRARRPHDGLCDAALIAAWAAGQENSHAEP